MAQYRHNGFDEAPTIREIEREVRWENDAVNRAVKQYRKQITTDAAVETGAGMAVIRSAMDEFVPHLTAMQETIRDQLVGSRGQPREWWTYVCLLDADKLAYLTLRAVLGERPCGGVVGGRKLTQCARALVQSVESEVAFQDWTVEERGKAREARKLGAPYQNQLEALKRRTKVIDNRAFKRWMARLERAWRQPWPEVEKLAFGAAMIRQLADHCGKLFAIKLVPRPGGKTELYIQATERALALMQDHHVRAEVAQPLDRPMLCRPKPWKWNAEEAPAHTEPATKFINAGVNWTVIEENLSCNTTVDITSTIAPSFAPA